MFLDNNDYVFSAKDKRLGAVALVVFVKQCGKQKGGCGVLSGLSQSVVKIWGGLTVSRKSRRKFWACFFIIKEEK